MQRDKVLLQAVGGRIRAARESKGWTQKQLAQACGWAQGTVSNYELGKRSIRLDEIEKLASVLGVASADLVFGGSGARPTTKLSSRVDAEAAKLLADWAALPPAFRTYLSRRAADIREYASGLPRFLADHVGAPSSAADYERWEVALEEAIRRTRSAQ